MLAGLAWAHAPDRNRTWLLISYSSAKAAPLRRKALLLLGFWLDVSLGFRQAKCFVSIATEARRKESTPLVLANRQAAQHQANAPKRDRPAKGWALRSRLRWLGARSERVVYRIKTSKSVGSRP
jgi:hypothetical protein